MKPIIYIVQAQADERQVSLINNNYSCLSWPDFAGRKLRIAILGFNWQCLMWDAQGTISCDSSHMTQLRNTWILTDDSENASVPTLYFPSEGHFLSFVCCVKNDFFKILKSEFCFTFSDNFYGTSNLRLFRIFRYFDNFSKPQKRRLFCLFRYFDPDSQSLIKMGSTLDKLRSDQQLVKFHSQ